MNIICPKCKEKLIKYDNSFKCINNHNYDIAKEGYINLNLHNSQNTGDNKEMINARTAFLNKGYYNFLRNEINNLLNMNDKLVDLACGEGYYTSYFIPTNKVGIDLSKTGLKYASKHDKGTSYILSSIFRCPLEDKCADKIITIFAPIAKEEIVRLLKDDGSFILIKPDIDHLYELKQKIYDNPYLNEVEDIEIPNLFLNKEIKIKEKQVVKKEDIHNLFVMTPYVNTTSKNDKEKLPFIDSLEITFSFIIDVYKKL